MRQRRRDLAHEETAAPAAYFGHTTSQLSCKTEDTREHGSSISALEYVFESWPALRPVKVIAVRCEKLVSCFARAKRCQMLSDLACGHPALCLEHVLSCDS